MHELYQLKRGESFDFVSEGLPPGPHKVISCWGVLYASNPPTDPWHLVCRDQKGNVHCLTLAAKTPVNRRA